MNNKSMMGIIAAVLVIVLGYFILTMPDHRTGGEKIGDAIDQAADGNFGNAAKELGDRTPADRLKDAAEDAKEDLKH